MIYKIGSLKKLLFTLFGSIILLSCQKGDPYNIDGKLPDTSFDGEWVYMVPLVKSTENKVDSAQIKNAGFSFKGKVSEPEIFVLQTRAFLRFMLEELTIVKETGSIEAFIGQNSTVKGTSLNDLLQGWNEQKKQYDQQSKLLERYYYSIPYAQRDSFQPTINSLDFEKNSFHFDFAMENRENVVGQMVIQVMNKNFSPEQKMKLGMQEL